MPHTLLAIDLGGTHCRFACFSGKQIDHLQLETLIRVSSKGSTCFDDIFDRALEEGLGPYLQACDKVAFALAGAKGSGQVPLVNLGWSLDVAQAAEQFQRPVVYLNDFAAHAFSWITSLKSSAELICSSTTDVAGPVGFVGPGTGFGKAMLLADQTPPWVLPSEGGHCTMTVETEASLAFYHWLNAKYQRPPTWDDVLSGRGLIDRYEHLYGQRYSAAEVAAQFADNDQLLAGFAADYGCACRQYALDVLPQGGMVLCGGITAKNPAIVAHPAFYDAFVSSVAQTELLRRIPIYHMHNEDSALWGAAAYGMLCR